MKLRCIYSDLFESSSMESGWMMCCPFIPSSWSSSNHVEGSSSSSSSESSSKSESDGLCFLIDWIESVFAPVQALEYSHKCPYPCLPFLLCQNLPLQRHPCSFTFLFQLLLSLQILCMSPLFKFNSLLKAQWSDASAPIQRLRILNDTPILATRINREKMMRRTYFDNTLRFASIALEIGCSGSSTIISSSPLILVLVNLACIFSIPSSSSSRASIAACSADTRWTRAEVDAALFWHN